MNLVCGGFSDPTVLLLGGLGMPTEAWSRAQPLVAREHRVCAFDPPGYRFSDLPAGPITAVGTATDLHQALAAAGLSPPYVLVAHSRAGFDARQFATLYPQDTAALVLLDVNVDFAVADETKSKIAPSGDSDACVRAAAASRLGPDNPIFAECGSPKPGSRALNVDLAKATLSQSANLELDAKGVRAISAYGDIPMIVITAVDIAGKWRGDAAAQKAQSDAHAALAAQSRRGEHRVVASGHMIMLEQPEVVARAVADVIALSGWP